MALRLLEKLRLLPTVAWIVLCPALLGASLASDRVQIGLWWELYCLAVTLMSPVAFLAYGWDKWRARREKSRVSEKSLHFLAVCGGWPGAVIGQKYFRHKTVKPVFRAILLAISLLHICVVLGLFLVMG